MTEDIIQQFQDDVWGLLTNEPGYRHIPVYRSRTPLEKDENGEPIVGQTLMIEESIEEALAGMQPKDGKAGIVAIVMMPDARPVSAESPGPSLELTLIIRFIENRLVNEGELGTGIAASRLGLHTMQVLQRRALRGSYAIRPAERNVLEEISLPDDRKAHELRMTITRGLVPLSKVARPAVSIDTGVMTVTCATANALIYWSADSSWPGPLNPKSWLYTLPVDLNGSTEVRVVAYDFDEAMQPSDDVIKEA
jgi:hypothetical protein